MERGIWAALQRCPQILQAEVKQLLKPCFNEMGRPLVALRVLDTVLLPPPCSNGGKLHFAHMQKIILKSQKERLQAMHTAWCIVKSSKGLYGLVRLCSRIRMLHLRSGAYALCWK